MKKLLTIIAMLTLSSVIANATLIGSLHIHPNQDITIGTNSVAGVDTRTSAGSGDLNTEGALLGSFSCLGGTAVGVGGHLGIVVGSFTSATKINDLDRYADDDVLNRGIAVWDFDLTGIVSNAWLFNVDFDQRRAADPYEDTWYISFNGMDRTLDTTDVTTLNPGDGVSMVKDTSKYVKIGDLPAGVGSGVYSWDLTEIVEAAQANDGKVRIVYSCDGFKDDIRFQDDSGLIATNIASGAAVVVPELSILAEDDFSIGTGSGTGNSSPIANKWVAQGPEEKFYNTVTPAGTNLTGKLGWSQSVDNSSFDGTALPLITAYTLAEAGDYVSVSFDYETTDTINNGTGLRVRLYEKGRDMLNDASGYGINIPSGTSGGSMSYRSFDGAGAFATGTSEGSAVGSGPVYGDGGSVMFTMTRTPTNTVVLSGWHSEGGKFITRQAASNTVFKIDSFGVSVGGIKHGLEIDNVQVRSSMAAPYTFVSDDFETDTASSSNSVLANGWMAADGGLEMKEYNVAFSGILDVRDELVEAEFDTVQIKFQDIPLTNNGDWLELCLDLQWYEDVSGESITNTADPFSILTLVDSGKTNNAGYGFRIKRELYHQLTLHDSAMGFPTQVPDSVTSRTKTATNGVFQTWRLRIERSGSDFLLSPSINGVGFGSTGSEVKTFTNSAAVDAVFDLLTLTVRGNNVGMKIDNVDLISNIESVVLTAFEEWVAFYDLEGTNALESANPDSDVLDNYHEYVFGGNPDDGNDIGTQPNLDVSSGDYVYVLRDDDSLTATVLTRQDLVMGNWITGTPVNVTANDGGLSSYTNNVGTATNALFIKLLVE